MLTRVALGQVRFTLPGLAPDARGVAIGRELVLRFATLERVVSFLRVLSGDRVPDELWGQLRLVYARAPRGPREMLALLPAPSVAVADAVARAARQAQGRCFTGTSRHYVPFRDAEAPLGYDVDVVAHEAADLLLYTPEQALPFALEGELSLEQLILQLELRRKPAPGPLAGPVYLTARRGIGPLVVEYLHRSGIEAAAALCEPAAEGAFGAPPAFWLVRVEALPPRLLGLVTGTPGVGLYLPVTEGVAVAAGHEHPVHLEACGAALQPGRFLLFQVPPAPVVVLPEPPRLVPTGDLVRLSLPPVAEPVLLGARATAPRALETPLRLVAGGGGTTRARAAWVPWAQVRWLSRLCYALPPTSLRQYRAAVLEQGVLVVAPERLEGLPFGELLEEAVPGVLVPIGARLVPAISPELLRERLALTEGSLVVFPSLTGRPFRVASPAIEPLERRLFGALEALGLQTARPRRPPDGVPLEPERPPEIEYGPLGVMPLWGLHR